MDPEDLVSVYTVNNPTEAEIVRNSLKSVGIDSEISGESQAGLAGVLEIQILTHESDAEAAREHLQELEREKDERKKRRLASPDSDEDDDTSESIQEMPPGSPSQE